MTVIATVGLDKAGLALTGIGMEGSSARNPKLSHQPPQHRHLISQSTLAAGVESVISYFGMMHLP